MEENLISIIMPSYNTCEYISNSIESVLSQTYDNWELIIVDDCSFDNTKNVVEKYLNDDRIKFFINQENIGAAESRNKAIKFARGKWIAFLDSDDIWHKNKLKNQLNFMINNDYKFSYTNYEEINQEGKSLKRIVTGPKKITKFGMYLYCWPGCLTVMYNARYIGVLKIENLKKNNDYAMWLKIIDKSECCLLDECLAKYRKRDGSISNQSKFKLIKHHYILFKDGLNKNTFNSIILTIINVFFGILKKKIYYKRIN